MFVDNKNRMIELDGRKFPKGDLAIINMSHKAVKIERLLNMGEECGLPSKSDAKAWDAIYNAIGKNYKLNLSGELYLIPISNLIKDGEEQYLTFDAENGTYYANVRDEKLHQIYTRTMLDDIPEQFKYYAELINMEGEK